MSKPSEAAASLPPQAKRALAKLGEDLKIARERRGESLRSWATRAHVSVPTLQRMEAGDPTVGMGVYATVLWLLGRAPSLAQLADPQADIQALSLDIERSSRTRRRP
jgi:hypothetical protein